jgi:hypothetical protein
MHKVVTLAEVRAIDAQRGSLRYVSKDTTAANSSQPFLFTAPVLP